jgi:hypothetical protein
LERSGDWHGKGETLDLAAAEELEARRRQTGLSLTRLNEQLRRPQGGEENITHGRVRKKHRRKK